MKDKATRIRIRKGNDGKLQVFSTSVWRHLCMKALNNLHWMDVPDKLFKTNSLVSLVK